MPIDELQQLEHKSKTKFVDPFLINQPTNELFVGVDGTTLLYSVGGVETSYYLLRALPVGTSVTMEMGLYGTTVYLTSEFEADKAKKKAAREAELKLKDKEARERARKTRNDAKAFNDALRIPFKWGVDHKVVMSGLSQNSWGCGTNRRTVMHVRVLEAFKDGRLKRDVGDFLCGKDDSVNQGYTETSENDKFVKVTCSQCLKVAKRFCEK